MFIDEDYQRERLAGTTDPKYLVAKYSKWTKKDYIICTLFIVALAVCIVILFWKAYVQHFRLQNCVLVEAEIISTDMEYIEAKGTEALTEGYTPRISFRYEIDGQTYTNDWLTSMKVLPVRSKREVIKFLGDYPLGERVTVYYVPGKPEKAFLLKYRFWNSFQGLILCSILLCFFIWFLPSQNDKYAFWKKFALCVYWFVVGFICYGYYFTYAERPYSTGVIIRCVIYFLLEVVWLYNLFKPRPLPDSPLTS